MSTRALYLEDFHPGQVFTSPGRTITETDMMMFAMLSGDMNPVHVDAAYAAATPMGQRIVHGLLGPAFMIGFLHPLGIFDGSAIAMLNITNIQFRKPLLINDTVHMRLEITTVRPTKDGQRGVVGRNFQLLRHNNELMQDMQSDVLVKKRPTA